MRGILHSCAKIIVGLLDVLYLYAKFNNLASRTNFSLTKHKRLNIWLHHGYM